MRTGSGHSFLDVFDLPDLEGEIVLWLARHSPGGATADELASALGQEPSAVRAALAALAGQGRVHLAPGGEATVVLGHVGSRTTLPVQLWNALQATDRTYSERDIATFRTAIPILQFARARMGEFADHGPGHALRVKSFASQLGYVMGLTPAEQGLLRVGALFHDIGNIADQERHNLVAQETVLRLTADGRLPLSAREAEVAGLLCRWHRGDYEPGRCDDLEGDSIRTGLLASILRVADAMDIDHRRSDYTDHFSWILRFFFPEKLPFWTSLQEILGARVHCTPAVHLQVFTRGPVQDNIQIDMLRGDLDRTPLDWSVGEVAVDPRPSDDLHWLRWTPARAKDPALLVFPFEPHSIVMAALSRKHLASAGYEVELLCYPDTAGGSTWLWGELLSEVDTSRYRRLVVIGDRPDPGFASPVVQTLRRWQASGAEVCLLNRHEANWSRLPALLQLGQATTGPGIEVILGGDWAYFWGEPTGQEDFVWGRIAALCTRDPAQSTVGLTGDERALTQGLLKVIYDATLQPATDTAGWASLARPILDRIQADDRSWFSRQAADFSATYGSPATPGRVMGRVLRFTKAPSDLPQAFYWALEAAIEGQGRRPEQGISFNVPYAVATWRSPDLQDAARPAGTMGHMVDLLAISHWREQDAIPIFLLYPSELGPPPTGNESIIQVRLPAHRAKTVVRALIDACNTTEG